MTYIATVIIPSYERTARVERAIGSILKQPNSESIEIIVVDDNSPVPILPNNLRSSDRIIRNQENVGAAVSRNKGIKAAKGEVVYLLDSDDYFITKDFKKDHKKIVNSNALFYCDIESQGYSSKYPVEITVNEYLHFIFHKYPFIAQTSTLAFAKNTGLLFDETLPKHQDWDLVFCGAFGLSMKVEKIAGSIFFDRGDKKSLSRTSDFNKSEIWFEKIQNNIAIDKKSKQLIHFNLFAADRGSYKLPQLLKASMIYYFKRTMSLTFFLKTIAKRYFITR
jgi:glycosyltransferase involved in cell wall biosynthesis